jgi:LacI family transcriptional regulator
MRRGDVTTYDTTKSTSRSADQSFSFSFGPLCILRRESTRGAGRRDPSVLEAVETIRREACDGLTAAALAEAFPASRKHFERRFREAMGHSVLDEILHVRLEKAQTLLLRRDVPIRDIAGLCGFRTGIELRKLFRLRFGVSMRLWRKEHAPESGEVD